MAAASQYPESVRYNSDIMEQIRLEVGLTKNKFTSAMRAIQMHEMSLDSSTTRATVSGKEAEGDSLIDSIPADDTVDVEGNATVAALAVQEALHQLPGPEASYISYKYGLHDGFPLSRAQVSCCELHDLSASGLLLQDEALHCIYCACCASTFLLCKQRHPNVWCPVAQAMVSAWTVAGQIV